MGSVSDTSKTIKGGNVSKVVEVTDQNLWPSYTISEIIGVKVPAYSYGSQPPFLFPLGVSPSQQALGEKVQALSQSVDDILARIENLKARREDAEQRGS